MKKKKALNKDFRLQVNLRQNEGLEIKDAALRENETVPVFVRRILLEEIDNRSIVQERESRLSRIESSQDFLLARLSKIERVLRMLVVNTAIARGHAAGVLELSTQSEHDVLHKRMLEAREQQKQTFFELFPELRDKNI